MAAQPRISVRGGQNPAYRPSGALLSCSGSQLPPWLASWGGMARQNRSNDWGFPRWRSYADKGRAAAKVRLCDREGCSEVGDRPAPKAPNSPERWYFCEAHAAEYNKNWNYFAGLSPE